MCDLLVEGRPRDTPSLKVICLEPILEKTVNLRNFQDVALISIEKDYGTHKPRGGVNWFLNRIRLYKKPELNKTSQNIYMYV